MTANEAALAEYQQSILAQLARTAALAASLAEAQNEIARLKEEAEKSKPK